ITFGQDGADANTVVSEEGLGLNLNPFRPPLHGSGLEDTEGHNGPDSTNAKSATGSFTVGDVDAGDALAVKLSTDGLPSNWKSGGQTITWSLNGDHVLVGKAGFGTVIEVRLVGPDSAGKYTYSVDLKAPIEHGVKGEETAGEDTLNLQVPIIVSDSSGAANNTTTGHLNIVIEDDSPRAVDVNGGILRESSEEQTNATFLGGNVLANILHEKALGDSDSAGWGADGPQGGLGNVLFGNPVQWS